MMKKLIHIVVSLFLMFCAFSCTENKVRSLSIDFINHEINLSYLYINYPQANTLFPIDFQSPTFHWTDSTRSTTDWFASISDSTGEILLESFVWMPEWKPDSLKWESLKHNYVSQKLQLTVIGFNKKSKNYTGYSQPFRISPDSVGADIFFRAVTLPFSYAVSNVHTIEWYMGSVKGGNPKKMLDNMPVCANCHSFSGNGPTLAMDVDYGNNKGSYALITARDTSTIHTEDIITWDNFKKDEGEPTFGLLSQISPSGKYVLSTVKDLSVFAAVDDNLAYSQLFFPIRGIIGMYNTETEEFSELQGANNTDYVQSNPVWSPDSKKVLFARTDAYINETVKKHGSALLDIDDIEEFKNRDKEFKFDIYSVDFNEGKGGISKPLEGASNNGKSNYFPKYSPDGKWIVFCQAENYMLLQPDSKLYIIPAEGGEARLMNCNMDNMNSWHSWSPNGRWLVFSSKQESLYTRLYLTHIDEVGNDSPPILLENLVFDERAANIPEFFPGKADSFDRIKDDFSNTAAHYARLATDNIRSKYFLTAERNLNRAMKLDPTYLDTYILKTLLNSLLLQINSETERAEKTAALELVDSLIAAGDDPLEMKYLKASILSSQGNLSEAEGILQSIVNQSPDFYRAYELLATIYKKSDRSDLVIGAYNKMRQLKPANELEINLLIAQYYLSQKKTDEALRTLRNLANRNASNLGVHENLCRVYMEIENLSEAKKEANLLLSRDPDNHSYHLLLSDIAQMEGDTEKAKSFFKSGFELLESEIEKNPENIPLLFTKANLLQKHKRPEEALEVYNGVLRDLPSNYTALKEKARIMLMKKKWQEAIVLYQNLLSTYNPEEEFYNNTAIAYINMSSYQEALPNFDHSLALNPTSIDALYNRSKLYGMMGKPKEAKEDLASIKKILEKKKNLTQEEKNLLEKLK